MLEWARRCAAADPVEGALLEHANDWFACMAADAVVKVAAGLDMHNTERLGAGAPLHPFMAIYRDGLGATLGRHDMRKEMGWAYYCPFKSRRAAEQEVIRKSRAAAERMVADMVERTRRWAAVSFERARLCSCLEGLKKVRFWMRMMRRRPLSLSPFSP